MDSEKTTGSRYEKQYSFGIWSDLYHRFDTIQLLVIKATLQNVNGSRFDSRFLNMDSVEHSWWNKAQSKTDFNCDNMELISVHERLSR